MLNLRSRFVKLALMMAVLPAFIMAITGHIAVRQFDAQLTAELKTQINADIAALVEIYSAQGPQALRTSIDLRLKLTPSNGAVPIYGLSENSAPRDAKPTMMANDPPAKSTDKSSTDKSNAKFIAKFIYDHDGNTLVRSTVLKGGEILTVGRSLDGKDDAISALKLLIRMAVIVCLVLGLLMGMISAWLFQLRLRRINDLCRDVAEGDVTARIQPDERGDEISHLSGNINIMLGRIQNLIAVRKRISDSVAHELRTPLAQLDGALHSAQEAAANPVPIAQARRELKDCVKLLDALLDVSALEAQSDDKTGFEVFDLSKTASELCAFYEALASEKQQRLTCTAPKPCLINGEPTQIGRLIANLIDNAIKYTPEHGEIQIAVNMVSEGVVFKVSDTGPGIAAQNRAEVFKPFTRNKTSAGATGHGFGLALVKAIADRHDAKISFTERASDVNGGTHIQVVFDKIAKSKKML